MKRSSPRISTARPSRPKPIRVESRCCGGGVLDEDLAAGDRREADERADLDVVGADAEAAAAQPVDALDLEVLVPMPEIWHPMPTACGRGPGRAARRRRCADGGALGQRRGHQRVLRGGDARLVEEDVRARSPALDRAGRRLRARKPTSAPSPERQEVRVHPPPADDVPPGRRQLHLARAREHRPGEQDGGADARRRRRIQLPASESRARTAPRCAGPLDLGAEHSSRSRRVSTSRMSGTFSRTTSSSVSSVAASIGSAAFLLPAGGSFLQAATALDDELRHSPVPSTAEERHPAAAFGAPERKPARGPLRRKDRAQARRLLDTLPRRG
jgi:hypothetical protein